jgi:pimeloyl-ACP methyl ester carboxylesterase
MANSRALSLSGLLHAGLRLVALPVAVLLVLIAAAIGNQGLAEGAEQTRFPAPGQLVDVGNGQLMHLRTWGLQHSNRPALLLMAGAAIPSSAWGWIGPALASEYRVAAIDRPGMGWSRGGSGPRTAQVAADDIATALVKLGIGPPYVVVAHSYAGFAARVFIGQHRANVVAAVMLDTSTPEGPGSGYGFFYRMDALKGHLGVSYLFPPPNGYASLPPDDAAAAYAVSRWTSHQDGSADELDVWDASAAQARAAGRFNDMPLLVVTTTGASEPQLGWQRQVATLTADSSFTVLAVGHTQMLTEPDQAEQVIAQIRDFLGRSLP